MQHDAKRLKTVEKKVSELKKYAKEGEGEYGIAVRWLGRLAEDAELRTFDLAAESTEEFIINSTELRCTKVELTPVQPAGPVVRRSRRRCGRGGAAGPQARPRPGQYTLPVQTEQVILRSCW